MGILGRITRRESHETSWLLVHLLNSTGPGLVLDKCKLEGKSNSSKRQILKNDVNLNIYCVRKNSPKQGVNKIHAALSLTFSRKLESSFQIGNMSPVLFRQQTILQNKLNWNISARLSKEWMRRDMLQGKFTLICEKTPKLTSPPFHLDSWNTLSLNNI